MGLCPKGCHSGKPSRSIVFTVEPSTRKLLLLPHAYRRASPSPLASALSDPQRAPASLENHSPHYHCTSSSLGTGLSHSSFMAPSQDFWFCARSGKNLGVLIARGLGATLENLHLSRAGRSHASPVVSHESIPETTTKGTLFSVI